MALRSLDSRINTMGAEEEEAERPKKMAKKAPTPTAAPDCETTAVVPQPNPAIDYIDSSSLEPLEQPELKINTLLEELESKDWTMQCEALNDVRRFALHHSTFLLPLLDKILLVLVKSMKNPRSALCKTSIMAASDVFGSFGHLLPPVAAEEAAAFDQLLLQLLIKASQDKKFVCEEAEKALDKMACCALPVPLLGKLRSYVKHTNLRVRAKAAVTISTCVSKMGCVIMEEFGLAALLQMAGLLLNDRLPEARESARSIVTAVHEAFVGSRGAGESEDDEQLTTPISETWQDFCLLNLPTSSAQSIVKMTSQQ